jgi:hypothetical protein
VAALIGTLVLALAAPAMAYAAYGAIAVNPSTGAWGVYYAAPTKAYAESRAKGKCPGACKIAVWVRDGCGAVVVTPSRYVAGLGVSKSAAVSDARRRAHDGRARVLAWVCSG